MFKIGIDLGGTKIEGVILSKNNEEIFRKRIGTEQDKGYDSILGKIRKLYLELTRITGKSQHTLGIGIPGTISGKTNLVKNANTTCLIGKPLKKDIEALLKRPVEIQNDANCFTLAEALCGAGKNKRFIFGVIMGTGCGGGIVIDGKIHAGLQGIAGEWGHTRIDPHGPDCYCGKKGCVETFISGGGLENIYFKKFGIRKNMPEIVKGYRQKREKEAEIFNDFIKHFGIAMSNLIDVLDPDIIILGGGLSNINELYAEGYKEIKKNIFSDSLETPVVKNKLGDASGVIGAAWIGI